MRRRRASSTRSWRATTSRGRFYALKARLLGLPRLKDYDRFAPLQEVGGTIAWDDAQELVLEAFTDFSPVAGEIIGDFFEKEWIDAAVRPGKMLGAFCATLIPDRSTRTC